jgi:alkanesulfonate monooxygenase SsuD/methylene tetrahydromethanopterin reductase-like flavin-dependent oxidoreductase (luciferase family)
VRVGVTLPTFRDDPVALDAARQAEELGLDGVFVFDHLWPMGAPERPALSAFPVLGALLGATERVCVGPLVARVGLVPDELLVAELVSLATMAPRRVIAGLGTGDRTSAAENLAYGVAFDPPDTRRLALRRVAAALLGAGVPVWVGGGATATTELAVELGAALNLWEGQPAALAGLRSRCEVTWAGPVPDDVAQIAGWLSELSRAGATWAVCAWPKSLEAVADAAALVRGGDERSVPGA